MVDFCLHLGQVHAATADDLFRFEDGHWVNINPAGGYLSNDDTLLMEDFTEVIADPVQIGPVKRIASYSGTLYHVASRQRGAAGWARSLCRTQWTGRAALASHARYVVAGQPHVCRH